MSESGSRDQIIMYTTEWCPDCWRAKKVMAAMGVSYAEVNISHDLDALSVVENINNGKHSVPTILFPDGSILTEPGTAQLSAKLAAYA